MTKSLAKKSKVHTRIKQETNMKKSKKKTWNMKYETRNNARNKSWKEIKTKERLKNQKAYLQVLLCLLAYLLAPPHNLNQSKYNMFPRIIFEISSIYITWKCCSVKDLKFFTSLYSQHFA